MKEFSKRLWKPGGKPIGVFSGSGKKRRFSTGFPHGNYPDWRV